MLAGSRDLRRTENIWNTQNRDIAITSCSEDKTSSALPGHPHHTAYHMKSQIFHITVRSHLTGGLAQSVSVWAAWPAGWPDPRWMGGTVTLRPRLRGRALFELMAEGES